MVVRAACPKLKEFALDTIPSPELADVTEPAVEAVLKAVLPVVAAADGNPAIPIPAPAAVLSSCMPALCFAAYLVDLAK